jgi:hypothetical protein
MICGSKGFSDGIDDILSFHENVHSNIPNSSRNNLKKPNRKEEELCLQELAISTDSSAP